MQVKSQFDSEYLNLMNNTIKLAKLILKDAQVTDLSDCEIDRAFNSFNYSQSAIKEVKSFRDNGLLSLDNLGVV